MRRTAPTFDCVRIIGRNTDWLGVFPYYKPATLLPHPLMFGRASAHSPNQSFGRVLVVRCAITLKLPRSPYALVVCTPISPQDCRRMKFLCFPYPLIGRWAPFYFVGDYRLSQLNGRLFGCSLLRYRASVSAATWPSGCAMDVLLFRNSNFLPRRPCW